jgi:hypothetical protein
MDSTGKGQIGKRAGAGKPRGVDQHGHHPSITAVAQLSNVRFLEERLWTRLESIEGRIWIRPFLFSMKQNHENIPWAICHGLNKKDSNIARVWDAEYIPGKKTWQTSPEQLRSQSSIEGEVANLSTSDSIQHFAETGGEFAGMCRCRCFFDESPTAVFFLPPLAKKPRLFFIAL